MYGFLRCEIFWHKITGEKLYQEKINSGNRKKKNYYLYLLEQINKILFELFNIFKQTQ